MARVHVADLDAGALTAQTTRAERVRRRLWPRPASGLFWSMNCDSWLVPKNSLIAATTGRMLIRVCGVIASTSWVVIRSRTTRSMRDRPTDLVLDQLADGADAAVAEVVDVVDLDRHLKAVRPSHLRERGDVRVGVVQAHQVLDDRDDVLGGQRRRPVHRVVGQAELLG